MGVDLNCFLSQGGSHLSLLVRASLVPRRKEEEKEGGIEDQGCYYIGLVLVVLCPLTLKETVLTAFPMD